MRCFLIAGSLPGKLVAATRLFVYGPLTPLSGFTPLRWGILNAGLSRRNRKDKNAPGPLKGALRGIVTDNGSEEVPSLEKTTLVVRGN